MTQSWWKGAVFYQIYMPSFRDKNNDGFGDFKGITEKLGYLKNLGIDAIWLTPFYPSPKVDNGYDISDYMAVDSLYGDLKDFEECIHCAHDLGIKVVADLVINHTSTEHPWFKESASSTNSSKRDWYIWKEKPNNWESFFGGSAWEYSEGTKQYYYHSFAKEQADLNWQNSEVKKAIYEVIEFWVNKGMDGFRLDVINNLTVHSEFLDNLYDKNGQQIHLNDVNQKGIKNSLEELIEKIKSQNKEVITIGEISSDKLDVISSYSGERLFDLTFNFNLGSIESFETKKVFEELVQMEKCYGTFGLPTLFFGSHDLDRSWNRLANQNKDFYKVLLSLMLTARGVPFIYYGEEIGMESFIPERIEDFRDVQGIQAYFQAMDQGVSEKNAIEIAQAKTRDKSRTPMQWSDEKNLNKKYWIPLGNTNNPHKMELLSYCKDLIRLRKANQLVNYSYDFLKNQHEMIYFKRGKYIVFLNFGKKDEVVRNNWTIKNVLIQTRSFDWLEEYIKVPKCSALIFEVEG